MSQDFLQKKINERIATDSLRSLRLVDKQVDFCSNDYLGIARLLTVDTGLAHHGSGGSRLLAGNYPSIESLESKLAAFHHEEASLIFNSGYDANLGLLSAVPQRGDTILYDYLSHASIRDGIRLSFAQSFSFEHNNLDDLEQKMKSAKGNCFVVTESVFSMDGDMAPLTDIKKLCDRYGAHLIVDEAHATGVIGPRGAGLVQQFNLAGDCFARVHTFGKALGCHGAVVVGSSLLRQYLINFARPFIYTTALPPSSIAAIDKAYERMQEMEEERNHLFQLIAQFQSTAIKYKKLVSNTAIQAVVVPGNSATKALATRLQEAGFDIRPILYPTVPKGAERLRIVLHSFNTTDELQRVLKLLS